MKSRCRFFFVMLFVGMYQCVMSQQNSSSESNNFGDKAAMIQTYIRFATSIAYKGYKFFTRENVDYDLQSDVLDVPYKKMIYLSTQAVEQLFDNANKHDNPPAQIQALILLCRMPIPEWYLKSFHKGLEILYALCFDEQGNFVDASGIHDIRSIFKDYCYKAPSTGQDVAEISDWWCKNKKPHPMYTKYYAATCTDYNEELLEMTQVDQLDQLVYLKYLLQKNESAAARKIYDYQVSKFLKAPISDIEMKK
ncbi:MAG: hypothetical protein Q8Q60_02560 [Candidatus Chromulinivorax sp.]|nr:hypothetical protein [Candidatus Chromulinivorax sp.]